MAADPNFSLVDVQTILRHACIGSTQVYLQPRLEELVSKVAELHERRRTTPTTVAVPSGYVASELAELLGLAL